MTDAMPTDPSRSNNLIDRAAQSADEALEATRRAADSVIDSVVDKVHSIRDTASPVMDRIVSPFDSISQYTREAPLKSLVAAAAVGAALMALIGLLNRSHRQRRGY